MSNNKITGLETGSSSGDAVHYGQFGASLASSGYQILPSGLIIQWGSFTGVTETSPINDVYESSGISVTWPIAFPNGLFQVIVGAATDVPGVGQQEQAWIWSKSTTGATVAVACREAGQSLTGTYLAIGY